MSRFHWALFGALALAAFVAAASRALAQVPPLCSDDLYLATGPPTLSVTATPATIDAFSGTSLIEARPLNLLGDPPQAGCQVELSTNLGSFASTGGSTASVQTDAQGVATDSFQCDGVVGTATITALIALPLPNNIGPTMTATTQVECTEPVVPPGRGGLWLEKVDQDGNPVPGAGFSIVGGGVALDCTTDEQGECHFEGLSAGDYAIEETLIPNGYTFLSCKPNPVTVPRDGQVTVTCLNERSTVEVPDLSIEKRHVVLDKDVQDDTGEDYIELAVGQTVFLAGKKDAFNQSDGPEPTSPSPALLLALTQKCVFGPLQQFDVVPDNLCFGHTFSGLPAIGAATLEIHLRAHPTDSRGPTLLPFSFLRTGQPLPGALA